MLFSYRKGIKKYRDIIQKDSIDSETRNLLWSALCEYYWNSIEVEQIEFLRSTGRFLNQRGNTNFHKFFRNYWLYYLKKPIDEFIDNWESFYNFMRDYFFKCIWNELFDFLELIYQTINIYQTTANLIQSHNNILERERVSYRIINNQFVDIVAEEEITEVEQAISNPNLAIKEHLSTALGFLYDRKKPDYRNSVKESISAVEAICKIVTTNEKATLGDTIKILSKESKSHPAFLSALDKLYGYTSDESGIRHSLIDMDKVDFAEAKFMLVICSAFINYIHLKMKI
jgi:hypothetical protein